MVSTSRNTYYVIDKINDGDGDIYQGAINLGLKIGDCFGRTSRAIAKAREWADQQHRSRTHNDHYLVEPWIESDNGKLAVTIARKVNDDMWYLTYLVESRHHDYAWSKISPQDSADLFQSNYPYKSYVADFSSIDFRDYGFFRSMNINAMTNRLRNRLSDGLVSSEYVLIANVRIQGSNIKRNRTSDSETDSLKRYMESAASKLFI